MRPLAIATLAVALNAVPALAQGGCHSKACEHRVAAKQKRWDAKWCARHDGCVRRVKRKAVTRMKLRVIAPYRVWLGSTGGCESGTGSPNLRVGLRAISPTGKYRGRYQFDFGSWGGAGGRGDPAAADWLEQAYRAVRWRLKVGIGAWPVCGH